MFPVNSNSINNAMLSILLECEHPQKSVRMTVACFNPIRGKAFLRKSMTRSFL